MASEFVDRHPERDVVLEVTESRGNVTVDGEPYGTLRRDTSRPTSREWVHEVDGEVTEYPAKATALLRIGKGFPLPTQVDGCTDYRVVPGPLYTQPRLARARRFSRIEDALAAMDTGVVVAMPGERLAGFHERHLAMVERLG